MIQILEGLYLGNREDARDFARLRQQGITHVLNCAVELPNYHEGRLTYLSLPLCDPDPRLSDHFSDAWHFIQQARSEKGGVLVHCFASVSRSPAIVLSYLCFLGYTLKGAAAILGAVLWCDPDYLFLRQIAEHFDENSSEESLAEVRSVLLGRANGEDLTTRSW